MKELYDFRIDERFADLLFKPEEGKLLGESVRRIVINSEDYRFNEIGELNRRLKSERKAPFFYSWSCRRKYSSEEIENAELFRLRIKPSAFFEPEGERCGTQYDESKACPICGAGAEQTSTLILDFRRIPKRMDVAATIARNEWIISQRLAEIMVDSNLTGFDFVQAKHKAQFEDDSFPLASVPSGRMLIHESEQLGYGPGTGRFSVWLGRSEQRSLQQRAREEYAATQKEGEDSSNKIWPSWYQIFTTSSTPDMVLPTRFGLNPFDEDIRGRYRCALGHTAGLRILSEISVARSEWDGSDMCLTRQYVGLRSGAIRPERLILVSPRLRTVLVERRVQGVEFEVAHLV